MKKIKVKDINGNYESFIIDEVFKLVKIRKRKGKKNEKSRKIQQKEV